MKFRIQNLIDLLVFYKLTSENNQAHTQAR